MHEFENKIGIKQIGPDIDSNRPYSFRLDGNFGVDSLANAGVCFWKVHLVKGIVYPDNPDERSVIVDYAKKKGLTDLGYDLEGNYGLRVGRGNVMKVSNDLKQELGTQPKVIG